GSEAIAGTAIAAGAPLGAGAALGADGASLPMLAMICSATALSERGSPSASGTSVAKGNERTTPTSQGQRGFRVTRGPSHGYRSRSSASVPHQHEHPRSRLL